MSSTRSTRASTTSSLMQDVPGAFPARTRTESYDGEQPTAVQTLSEAVYARRAEYVKSTSVRIKIGTWNVAAHKGAEIDIGEWFVASKGVSEALAGLSVEDQSNDRESDPQQPVQPDREGVESQEARYEANNSSVPHYDTGSKVPSHEEVGLYVLGLQEIVDINSATEALRPYTDPSAAKKWKDALESSLPDGYSLIAEQQLIGLLLLIYASPDVAKNVKSVSTTSVGTGLMGYMGNKGAVTARIVLGETTRLVFINSHLAAGADKASLERRNWDAQQIVQRTKFEPIQDAMDLCQSTGEQLGDEDFAFWVGDLNYRLEGIPGDDVRRLLMLHTRNEYDLSQRSARKIEEEIAKATSSAKAYHEHRISADSVRSATAMSPRSSEDTKVSSAVTEDSSIVDQIAAADDPTSLQTTISSLLPHDELHQQMRARRAFHDGWKEGPISFLPTYKYDVGSVGVFDSSEKKRAPSWCDRILYRTRRDKLAYEAIVRDEELARKKDDEMTASGFDQAAHDEEILYDYDPETDGTSNFKDDTHDYETYDDEEDGVVITKQGFEDEMHLEYYVAHQRVLSSDHKPLNAVFLLKYDAVVPDLKATVHAEVAKELDKAENEGRPNVTVVVDSHSDSQTEQSDSTPGEFEGVWFGGVRWAQAKHRTLTIANTSRVPATFSFLERHIEPDQSSVGIAPSWLNLRINQESVASSINTTSPITLEPGETSSVDLEIRVLDINLVHGLNDGSHKLDDILVLRIEGGRDHFIPVRAKWLVTSLGRSIDKLIRIPEGGIRKLQHQNPDSSKGDKGTSSDESTSVPTAEPAEDHEPVRFSAPRELFRLTEAIEELGARVVAEWTMTSSDNIQDAPWVEHPGWPFHEKCWTERGTSQWNEALSDACNALDTDDQILPSFSSELPQIQRLYVLSSLLLLFLQHMPDGVVDEKLWTTLESSFTEKEKSKHKGTTEEQRTAVQEVLSQYPSHNISFILIMTMLERLLVEISGANIDEAGQPHPHTASPNSKRGPLRRMAGLGRTPSESSKDQIAHSWAQIFAAVMVRTQGTTERHKSSKDKRKTELLEIFLRQV